MNSKEFPEIQTPSRWLEVKVASSTLSLVGGRLATRADLASYPSLNHCADWLQRSGINSFLVDLTNWRDPDTGRTHGAACP